MHFINCLKQQVIVVVDYLLPHRKSISIIDNYIYSIKYDDNNLSLQVVNYVSHSKKFEEIKTRDPIKISRFAVICCKYLLSPTLQTMFSEIKKQIVTKTNKKQFNFLCSKYRYLIDLYILLLLIYFIEIILSTNCIQICSM